MQPAIQPGTAFKNVQTVALDNLQMSFYLVSKTFIRVLKINDLTIKKEQLNARSHEWLQEIRCILCNRGNCAKR